MRPLTLVAGQGDMGGGEQMLLRIGEAAQALGWRVRVVGPGWGDLSAACSARGFDFVEGRGTSRRAFALSAATYLARPRLGVVWANGALPGLAAVATPNPLVVHLHQRPSRSQAAAIRPALLRAQLVLVPSESMRVSIPRSRVLLNWTKELEMVARSPDPGAFTLAYLGRISRDKGVDTLAEAANALAREGSVETRLLIAGDDRFVRSESSDAVHRALKACSAQVTLMGWSEPSEVMSAADVIVVPSRWAEPFGLVAAETMALGCPLVVSDAGALPEVVGEGYPWMFPAGDAGALAALLSQLRQADLSDCTTRMRQRWKQCFSPEVGLRRVEGILASVQEKD